MSYLSETKWCLLLATAWSCSSPSANGDIDSNKSDKSPTEEVTQEPSPGGDEDSPAVTDEDKTNSVDSDKTANSEEDGSTSEDGDESSGESDNESETTDEGDDGDDSVETSESEGEESDSEESGEDPDDLVPARGDIEISLVEANQVVAAKLVDSEGKFVPPDQRKASLVSARKTLFRAYWSTPSDWSPREIVGRLQLQYEDGSLQTFDETIQVEGKSEESDLTSTFSWLIEADHIRPEVKFQIKFLEDKNSNMDIPDSSSPAIAPASGFELLGNESDPVELNITIVPIIYKSDSCDTDSSDVLKKPEYLQGLNDIMFSRNHAQKLNLSIREESVEFKGSQWNEVLRLMQSTRMADNAPPNEYYYALVNACGKGLQGFGGMSKIPGASKGEGNSRVASGQWAQSRLEYSYVTFVHELGHTQGLRHAPCGSAGGPDPNFPHAGAKLGTWGYDIIKELYKNPTDVTDYMSYCYIPSWCSDYHCKKTFQREKTLSSWNYQASQYPEENDMTHSGLRRHQKTSKRLPQGELLYGSLLENDSREMWWTVAGNLPKHRTSQDTHVEFYVGDVLLAREPALVESYSEPGYGEYLIAQVPLGFEKVTRIVRSNAQNKQFSIDPRVVERDYLLYYSVEDKIEAANLQPR